MNSRKMYLEPLTPVVLNEEEKQMLSYENYVQALDEAFHNDKICNIALSGPYGAGKSTIMQTYESEQPDRRCIHISLAKFQGANESRGKEAVEEGDQRNLEIKVLNQLIHQIPPRLIPQTQFRIKKDVGSGSVWKYAISLFLLFFSVLYLVKVPAAQWDRKAVPTFYASFSGNIMNWIVLLIFMAAAGVILYSVVNRQLKQPLIKAIQVDKSQIDLVEDENEAKEHQFDRYMDEIIYLFRKGRVDALILEDIDRFGTLDFFNELREMNFLINQKQLDSQEKRVVKFFYMVRDELFADYEQRTKFFDLIIPVIPAMDSSNSYEVLSNMLKREERWNELLPEEFLRMVCSYIKDYRVLKNIYNEFQIYYNQLRIEEMHLNAQKLFAMVVYKNILPADYAGLQRGEGAVYRLFEQRTELRDKLSREVREQLEGLYREEQDAEREFFRSLQELDAVFFCCPGKQKNGYFIVDGKTENAFSDRAAFVAALRQSGDVVWRDCTYSYIRDMTLSAAEINTWFQQMEGDENYTRRKKRLHEAQAEQKERRAEKCADLKKRLEQIEKAPLSELLECGGENTLLDLTQEEIADGGRNNWKLIGILLREGKIAEDYTKYMTYFYPYSLTQDEQRFLNHVWEREAQEGVADIVLSHPERVMKNIRWDDYQNPALPNKYLLAYILGIGREEAAELLVRNLRYYKNYSFVMAYSFGELDKTGWYRELANEWNTVLEEILSDPDILLEEKLHMLLACTENSEPVEQREALIKEGVSVFIADHEHEVLKQCGERGLLLFAVAGICFHSLDSMTEDSEKWGLIYRNHMYGYSKEIMEYILCREYELEDSGLFWKENYSTVISRPEQPLAIKVEADVLSYVKECYLPLCASVAGEEKSIVLLLNRKEIDDETKRELIDRMPVAVEELRTVKDESLWTIMIERDKVSFRRDNIMAYWLRTEEIDAVLEEYLSRHYQTENCRLSFVYMRSFLGETKEQHGKTSLLLRQMLSIRGMGEGYDKMLSDLNVAYQSFPWNLVEDEQLKYLVKNRVIQMTESNLKALREKGDFELFLSWVKNDFMAYYKLVEEEELQDEDELHRLIDVEELSDNQRSMLVAYCRKPIVVKENYNSTLVEAIIDEELLGGGYKALLRRYDSAQRYTKTVKKKIEEYFALHVQIVMELKMQLPDMLLCKLCGDARIQVVNKISLIAKQAAYHTRENVLNYLTLAKQEAYLAAMEGRRVKVEADESAHLMLEALKNQRWISSYKAEDDEYVVWPKRVIK